ncbi:hypothetical protein N7500_009904 [Penicillium coprophilum]|nr:hypothetical protein N7500_009904 [Penicillium coprophilum]
MGRQRKKKK